MVVPSPHEEDQTVLLPFPFPERFKSGRGLAAPHHNIYGVKSRRMSRESGLSLPPTRQRGYLKSGAGTPERPCPTHVVRIAALHSEDTKKRATALYESGLSCLAAAHQVNLELGSETCGPRRLHPGSVETIRIRSRATRSPRGRSIAAPDLFSDRQVHRSSSSEPGLTEVSGNT